MCLQRFDVFRVFGCSNALKNLVHLNATYLAHKRSVWASNKTHQNQCGGFGGPNAIAANIANADS